MKFKHLDLHDLFIETLSRKFTQIRELQIIF